LPTWEIVEVDGGHLVGINPEMIKPLVIDGIKQGVIEEFLSYNVLHAGNTYEQSNQQWLLLEKDDEKCYICLEHVTLGNDQGDGFFPEIHGMGTGNIKRLIKMCGDGHKAILLFCVMHTGLKNIKAAYHIDSTYEELLQKAMNAGVQLFAYKVSISLQGIEFTTKIPILFSKDAAYKEH
jgi:sugar fermentation stimulation protein A